MEFTQLMQARRAVRDYLDQPVPTEEVRSLLEEAVMAPSAGNRQPWGFIVVNDKSLMKQISEECKAAILKDIEAKEKSVMRVYEPIIRKPEFNIFYNAPCLVYITGPARSATAESDCALAAAYLMLAAANRGLGTCWVAMGGWLGKPRLESLGLPEGGRIIAPIVIGHPAAIPGMPARKPPHILNIFD